VSSRIDLETPAPQSERGRVEPPAAASVAAEELTIESTLPADHPAWSRDRLSLSAQARLLLAKLKPVALRVLTFWDHRLRSAFVGGRKLTIDASGSYRLDPLAPFASSVTGSRT
jgi:hypothetical protein